MGRITYESHGDEKKFVDGIGVEYDTETDHWVMDQFVDRGGLTHVARVPVHRVYSVSQEVSADEPSEGDASFIDGRITYEGPDGEENIDVGGLVSNTTDAMWFDDETDHWVVRKSRDGDKTVRTHYYIPSHRVYLIGQRLDRDGALS